MYVTGILVLTLLGLSFLYLFYEGYIVSTTQKFLSLSSDAGICDVVLKPLSGVYLADDLGHWEGHVDFSYVGAKYEFTISQLLLSPDEWRLGIGTSIEQALNIIGYEGEKSDLARNLLIWMAWSLRIQVGDSIQIFRLTGHPEVIFRRAYHIGSIGSFAGDCKIKSDTQYDQAGDHFALSFSEVALSNDSLCVDVVSPDTLGFDERYDLYAHARFDSRSVAVAAAVNQGVTTLAALVKITDISRVVTVTGVVHEYDEYFDPRFPEMEAVMCTNTKEIDSETLITCLVFVNDVLLVYPLFNHYGALDNTTSHLDTEPQPCSCADGSGYSFNCNAFNLLTGFLFYNTGDDRDSNLRGITELVMNYSNQTQLNSDAYYGMFAAAAAFTSGTRFDDPAFRHQAYDFCHLPGDASASPADAGLNCSILAINSYDTFHTISPYYLVLPNGSCTDTMSASTIEDLAAQPPDQLTEKFFECSDTLANSLINSLGISVGMVQLFSPIVVLLAVGLAHTVASLWGKTSHRQYVPGDRESILDVLALQLLLVRDENMVAEETRQRSKRRRRPTMPPQTTLHNIVAETKSAVLESDGYLDMVAHQNGIHDLRPALGLPAKGKSGARPAGDEEEGLEVHANRVPFGGNRRRNPITTAGGSGSGVRCEHTCTGDYKGSLCTSAHRVGTSIVTVIPPLFFELPGPTHTGHNHATTGECNIRVHARPAPNADRLLFPLATITNLLPVTVNEQMHIGQVLYTQQGHIIISVRTVAPLQGGDNSTRVLSVQEVSIEQCSLFHMAASDNGDDDNDDNDDNENTPVRVIRRAGYRRAGADEEEEEEEDEVTVIGSLYKFLNSP